jgi:hypothetical protein
MDENSFRPDSVFFLPNDVPDDIRRMLLLYLEKLEMLTEEERGAYIKYFNHLMAPIVFIDKPGTE